MIYYHWTVSWQETSYARGSHPAAPLFNWGVGGFWPSEKTHAHVQTSHLQNGNHNHLCLSKFHTFEMHGPPEVAGYGLKSTRKLLLRCYIILWGRCRSQPHPLEAGRTQPSRILQVNQHPTWHLEGPGYPPWSQQS